MKQFRHHVRQNAKGILQLRTVGRRLLSLLKTPFFWLITFWGNAWVLFGAWAFHAVENGKNPALEGFLDSLIWSVGIVTTVGGGSITPLTFYGKVLTVVMMMGGALFLWSYMAIFVGAFVDPELKYIEKEVSELQHELHEGEHLLQRLKELSRDLEIHLASSNSTKIGK